MKANRAWLYYVCLSLLIAVSARLSWRNTDLAVYVSVSLSVFWVAMLGGGLYRYHWRGLWILIGAPFALYYPYLFSMLDRACSQNIKACP
jgi:hypothetical protein